MIKKNRREEKKIINLQFVNFKTFSFGTRLKFSKKKSIFIPSLSYQPIKTSIEAQKKTNKRNIPSLPKQRRKTLYNQSIKRKQRIEPLEKQLRFSKNSFFFPLKLELWKRQSRTETASGVRIETLGISENSKHPFVKVFTHTETESQRVREREERKKESSERNRRRVRNTNTPKLLLKKYKNDLKNIYTPPNLFSFIYIYIYITTVILFKEII